MERIAEAKARGVRFGRRLCPGQMILMTTIKPGGKDSFRFARRQTPCGIMKAAFCNAVLRKKQMKEENPA